jgi:uncharacterized RDD family membrane protein YckC
VSTIHIRTNFNIDLEFHAAPFGRRLVSWFLDVVSMFIYLFVSFWLLDKMSPVTNGTVQMVLFVLMILPFLLYHLLMEYFMNGQSIGKKVMKLKVVNENGGQPSISQYIIRWLIRTSDIMIIVIALNVTKTVQYGDITYLWEVGIALGLLVTDIILVNSRKQQRLGDLLAHTLVIMARQNETINDTVFLEVADTYIPSFPEVMRLSDRDINSLKGILDSARKRNDYNLAEMASEKIKTHLKIHTSLSPFDFLEILLKDYNYLATK